MRSTRMAISAAVLGVLALPVASASAATAAPASAATALPAVSCSSNPYLPWAVHGTSAVTIRAKATTASTAVGILYKKHRFTVHKTTKGATWVYITDKTTKVTGWASGTYVYRDVRTCLD
ncbi:SH3 domain-containing protein [Streptomyces sp. NPDC091280]|uniref:SH3 domain-containing protein n=1 Tax=Streptomyces sp. NPDC091280 TaxID=3365984 RepID=UPI003824252A